MLNHKMKLISKIDSLKYILSKLALMGWLAKWVMILSQYEIQYVERRAINGQFISNQLIDASTTIDHPLVSDFLNESIFTLDTPIIWNLYFDGSHTSHGLGVGILFVTTQGDTIQNSFRISFACTNNIVEYEGLLIGLHMAMKWKIKSLQFDGDSQLVIRQVNDDYDTKDEMLTPYK